ncbi:hypothetical protein [Rheinheimera sp. F8]|uniref:hypothetical protein n=1 Tax=Rheinheimera sp. F8 TaxID=1763998 RepID=UPI0007449BAC|nr:hypothetical protein [Rheinheimera sp. F8]ALZ75397.1 hypothetical protein ATY27_06275 [Rheinheimera sp. F8]ALZ75789.1 hypothetical protein ATY27_08430 [Rheinheimera sp. F8]
MEGNLVVKITEMIKLVDIYKLEIFDENLKIRNRAIGIDLTNHDALLRHLAILVVYSQQAQSNVVKNVIESGSLDKVFYNFDTKKVSKINPCDLVDEHWESIKGIRQQTKIFQIVMLARKIPLISNSLMNSNISKHITCSDDLSNFWAGFSTLKKEFQRTSIPFFRETTSLLHLLTSLGYDCIKPDSAVLKSARKLGILSSENPSNKELINVVKTIQSYSIHINRAKPPPVLDLYLLVHGKQTEASNFVSNEYYQHT